VNKPNSSETVGLLSIGMTPSPEPWRDMSGSLPRSNDRSDLRG
jgi:hypothetical protein